MEFNETQKGRITREIIPLSNNNILFFFHPSEHREKFSRGNTKFKGTEEEQEKEERKEKQVSPAFSKKPAPATLPHQPPRKKKDKGRTKGSGKKIRRKIRSRIPRPHSQSLSLSLSLGSPPVSTSWIDEGCSLHRSPLPAMLLSPAYLDLFPSRENFRRSSHRETHEKTTGRSTEIGEKTDRTEPSRTEPNRTEPIRIEPNRTESKRIEAKKRWRTVRVALSRFAVEFELETRAKVEAGDR